MSILTIAAIVMAFLIGYFIRGSESKATAVEKTDNEEIQEKKERYKRTTKAFNELMDYDYSVALGGGRNE